ncbi:MAG: radical SAM protein [bacterium]|nr:radical SAM protein [bacterium]
MRVAFVSGNREKLPDAVIPLGILSVLASTPDRHEKRLIDLCFERYPTKALQSELESFRPDVIGLGMRNIQNADYTGNDDHLAYYTELITAARQVSSAPIVLGGSGFSVAPKELMERLQPDYGIAGEAEASFPQLLDRLEGRTPLDQQIGGLFARQNGRITTTPADEFLNLATLAMVDRSLLDPRYYERYGIDSVQTKRGCPLHCDYCTYPTIEGRVGRLRPPTAVVDEMHLALEQQPEIRHFFLVDSVFNLPRSHAKDVCRELISRDWRIPWTCYANPLGFDREFARLARNAGCTGMEIGSDSGVDRTLERLRKGFTTQQIREMHKVCKDEGIPDCHTFILGTRDETLEDVERSLEFIVSLDPYAAILTIWVEDYEALDPELRRDRLRLRARIEERLSEHKDEFPYWIIPPLGVNFDRGLFRRLRRQGLHGPLWQYLRSTDEVEALGAAFRARARSVP